MVSLRRQLLAGAVLLGLGSLASACAPSIVVLLAAQVPLGVGVAGLTTAGTLAAAEWVPEEHRMRTLSWAVVGQPAAWIVGMPLVGLVGAGSWRLGWIALPLAASLVAALAVLSSRAEPEARAPRHPVPLRVALESDRLRRWLVSELLANAAWVGTLVYAGAMLVDEHHASSGSAGVLLASAAVGYIAGTLGIRRAAVLDPHLSIAVLALGLAVCEAAFWWIRPDELTSTVLLTLTASVAGGRTLLSNSHALGHAPEIRTTLTGLRVATVQLGYFLGSIAGGVALAVGGYVAVGCVFGVALVLAAAITPRPSRSNVGPAWRVRPAKATAGTGP